MMELPLYSNIDEVRQAANGCQACGRAETRTQVVFGAGNPGARIMLVGEAPSSSDDVSGIPYSGPAGDLLDELLAEAGTTREQIWITNLLRCFEGRERGGQVENQPARLTEIRACSRWLNLEIQYVDPAVILAIGAPAARALIGSDFRLTERRGKPVTRPDGRTVVATLQPAYVMRIGSIVDDVARVESRALVLADLTLALRLASPIN